MGARSGTTSLFLLEPGKQEIHHELLAAENSFPQSRNLILDGRTTFQLHATDSYCKAEDTDLPMHGLSQYLETGCPNRGFIDFCVSKVWYKVHATNKLNPT